MMRLTTEENKSHFEKTNCLMEKNLMMIMALINTKFEIFVMMLGNIEAHFTANVILSTVGIKYFCSFLYFLH